jgi:porphobilinogen synthase
MIERPRRLRSSPALRRMIRETTVQTSDLIYPLFIHENIGEKREIPSLPGIYHLSLNDYLSELEKVAELNIPAVLLFGIPADKDETGSGAYRPDGIVQRALRLGKERFPELIFIADVCLCEYTSHGHCGLVREGRILNDATLPLLGQTAVSYAESGADIVAPSDMMDGRVGAIRQSLDERGLLDTVILSYSAKYASAFYGPFREAAQSRPQFGDRKTYQMDCANLKEALREVELDLEEGADMVMVKPALAYLDVIREVCQKVRVPVAAYQVSGEYAMIKAAADRGWIDEPAAVMETLTAIKRAGASLIITYFAKEIARWLQHG